MALGGTKHCRSQEEITFNINTFTVNLHGQVIFIVK